MREKSIRSNLKNTKKKKFNDFCVHIGGKNIYIPAGLVFGSYMYDCYVIEYCKSGGMTLLVDGVSHQITAGDLYLVEPYHSIEKHYTGDATATVWVAVGGVKLGECLKEIGVSSGHEVFPMKLTGNCAAYLEDLVDSLEMHGELTVQDLSEELKAKVIKNPDFSDHFGLEADLRESALFCRFLSELISCCGLEKKVERRDSLQQKYVNEAIHYMETNYSYDISVSSIAKHLGITRNYLFSVFREQVGMSVQEYLMQVRMKIACEFLRKPDVLVKTVAASVGYEPLTFSRTFKKQIGLSPTEYRKKHEIV